MKTGINTLSQTTEISGIHSTIRHTEHVLCPRHCVTQQNEKVTKTLDNEKNNFIFFLLIKIISIYMVLNIHIKGTEMS